MVMTMISIQYKKTFALVIFLSAMFSMPTLACNVDLILAEAMTLDEAVKDIKSKKHGKVLNAKTVEIEGEPVHVIKVLTENGRVKKIRVNTNEK